MVETLRSNEFNEKIGGSQSIGSHAPQTPMDACFFYLIKSNVKIDSDLFGTIEVKTFFSSESSNWLEMLNFTHFHRFHSE